jgi:hypothetical protein
MPTTQSKQAKEASQKRDLHHCIGRLSQIVSAQIVSEHLGPRKKGVYVCQIRPTDESWNHFHSFLDANTINLCRLHANIFLCNLMLTICSNVWRVNTVLPFLTTFLAISKKNVKHRKKTRNLLLSSVLVNFCRHKKNVDISSTKHAFFVL